MCLLSLSAYFDCCTIGWWKLIDLRLIIFSGLCFYWPCCLSQSGLSDFPVFWPYFRPNFTLSVFAFSTIQWVGYVFGAEAVRLSSCVSRVAMVVVFLLIDLLCVFWLLYLFCLSICSTFSSWLLFGFVCICYDSSNDDMDCISLVPR